MLIGNSVSNRKTLLPTFYACQEIGQNKYLTDSNIQAAIFVLKCMAIPQLLWLTPPGTWSVHKGTDRQRELKYNKRLKCCNNMHPNPSPLPQKKKEKGYTIDMMKSTTQYISSKFSLYTELLKFLLLWSFPFRNTTYVYKYLQFITRFLFIDLKMLSHRFGYLLHTTSRLQYCQVIWLKKRRFQKCF